MLNEDLLILNCRHIWFEFAYPISFVLLKVTWVPKKPKNQNSFADTVFDDFWVFAYLPFIFQCE